jgi:hypothetical protein
MTIVITYIILAHTIMVLHGMTQAYNYQYSVFMFLCYSMPVSIFFLLLTYIKQNVSQLSNFLLVF